MKTIIAAFDGLKYSESTKSYALYLAQQMDSQLIGVFMDDPTYTSYNIYEKLVKEGVSEAQLKKLKAIDNVTRDAAVAEFEKACREDGLKYSVHRDRNIATQEVKLESIYSDLLIIDSKETLTRNSEKLPTRFIRDLLSDAQCPVLVVPQKYKAIHKIVLLYDGEPSSVHAIKMFNYLMPELKQLPTEVVLVNPVNTTLQVPNNQRMKEFVKMHFPKAKYTIMRGWAEDEIVKHLKKEKNHSLVVLGAYRRGAISRWFRESMADILMNELKFPLFIAHNK